MLTRNFYVTTAAYKVIIRYEDNLVTVGNRLDAKVNATEPMLELLEWLVICDDGGDFLDMSPCEISTYALEFSTTMGEMTTSQLQNVIMLFRMFQEEKKKNRFGNA